MKHADHVTRLFADIQYRMKQRDKKRKDQKAAFVRNEHKKDMHFYKLNSEKANCIPVTIKDYQPKP